MKFKCLMLILMGLILAAARLPAQALSGDSEKKARDLLRQTVDQRERPAPAPIYTGPSAAIPASPAPNLSPTGLKSPTPQLSYAEIEQAYLSGRISARQFQRYLENRKLEPTPSPSQTMALRQEMPPSNAPIVMKGAQPAAAVPAKTSPGPNPAVTQEQAEPAAPPSAISDVEKKMDELLRLKAARDQAAMAASAALSKTNVQENAAPKTKRERMDELLRLYINGKVSESEYKEKREKLIAE